MFPLSRLSSSCRSTAAVCTATGQVLTSFADELSVIDLNGIYSESLEKVQSDQWHASDVTERKAIVRNALQMKSESAKLLNYEPRGMMDSPLGELACGLLSTGGERFRLRSSIQSNLPINGQ